MILVYNGNRYGGMWCHGKHQHVPLAEIVLGDELFPLFAMQEGLPQSFSYMNVVRAPKGMKQHMLLEH